MESLRLSAVPEIYDRKRYDFLGHFDAFEADSTYDLYVRTKKLGRGYPLGSGFRNVKCLKAKAASKIPSPFVSGQIVWNLNSKIRLKNFRLAALEAAGGRNSVTGLDGKSNPDDCINLVGTSLTLKNPTPKFVETQTKSIKSNYGRKNGRNIWTRIIGLKKASQRKVLSPVALTSGRSIDYAKADSKLESVLSAIGPKSEIEDCVSILQLLEKKSDEKTMVFFKWMRSNGKLKQNISAYFVAFRVLARKEDWDTAQLLIQEMTSESGCQLNSQIFNSLIRLCTKRGLVDWGTKLFQMMLDSEILPNTATVSMLMGLYQKTCNVLQAEFTFNHMRSFKLHCVNAYSAMIIIYTRLGLYDKSEEIIHLMDEDGVLPNLENWLVRLNAYSQQGKLREAEDVLKSMQEVGIAPNIVAYNTLITGYGKSSDAKAAECVFQRLQTVGIESDETTYRSLIEGFGRTDNYKEALHYYRELKRSGFRPNSSNFYTLINLHARHGDDKDIVQTLKDMRVAGCQYSSIVGSLLQAYQKVGRIEKVGKILKASFYEKILLDQTSTSILVMAYVKSSLLDDALQVLQDKRWKDSDYEDSLYHLLICSCKECGCYEDAVRVYNEMPLREVKPNLLITCSMIDIFSELNKFTEAEKLYLNLKASGSVFDMIAYSVVVRMYIKAGSLKDACLTLDMMEKQKDIMPDTFLFRDMLRVYQQCGMVEKLSNAYYWVLRSGVVLDEAMYNCVINCCGHALPVDELSRLFNDMIHRGFNANTITLNVMIDVYGKAGFLGKARKVFWMARRQHLADIISYNTIISVHGKNKDLKGMAHFFRRMQDAGYLASLEAFNSMLDAYGKQGQLEEFNNVLQKMKEASYASDHYTYNIMINIYGKKGWIEEVAGVLAELKERGLEPDLYSYNTLIKAYGIAGLVEEAVHVVQEIRLKGIEPDRVTFSNLIAALQRNENFLEAIKWSLWMKQTGISK